MGIDIRLVADSSQLGELLNTTTHEMRHQLQTDALRNPDAFPDIPQETLDQWEYEFTNYVDPSYDFEGYQARQSKQMQELLQKKLLTIICPRRVMIHIQWQSTKVTFL